MAGVILWSRYQREFHADTIMGKHPGSMFLDNASSQEEAEIKIQRDRDGHKPFWM